MTWTKFFDAIYLINLPHRTQRFMDAAEELEKYDIPFGVVHAYIGDSVVGNKTTGAEGLWQTMKKLMNHCRTMDMKRVLVFEDDLEFVENPNNYMPAVIRELNGKKWDMLSLGPNTHKPLTQVSEHLLLMDQCRGLHAMAYNRGIIDLISINQPNLDGLHLDQFLEEFSQPRGNCYCTYPLLATQRNGPSDISEETDKSYIVKRFRANTIHLETK